MLGGKLAAPLIFWKDGRPKCPEQGRRDHSPKEQKNLYAHPQAMGERIDRCWEDGDQKRPSRSPSKDQKREFIEAREKSHCYLTPELSRLV